MSASDTEEGWMESLAASTGSPSISLVTHTVSLKYDGGESMDLPVVVADKVNDNGNAIDKGRRRIGRLGIKHVTHKPCHHLLAKEPFSIMLLSVLPNKPLQVDN